MRIFFINNKQVTELDGSNPALDNLELPAQGGSVATVQSDRKDMFG
jgi:hypothetical protein